MIRILDCTLRDGGYVNHFAFGDQAARQVIARLSAAGVEYIEVGFLRNTKQESETTVFRSVEDIGAFLPVRHPAGGYFAMIVYGQYDDVQLPRREESSIDGIRVTFKKHEVDAALDYICRIRAKGYTVSANPTAIHSYSDQEFIALLEKINQAGVDIFALVDTMGLLKRTELLKLLYLVDHNLDKEVDLAFHSHNNLQMSFAHAQTLIEAGLKRNLIIDSSLRGMGRGAGNLCTELLLQYLNDTQDKQYNLVPVLIAIDEHIDKIYARTPWGYNLPYYLAASLRCHPNYAAYLVDKGTVSIAGISEILACIPEEQRTLFQKGLIEQLYLDYQSEEVDDTHILQDLKDTIGGREVLLLGPGKTMDTERETIHAYISQQAPCVISINYRPRHIRVDKVFISNAKRFAEQTNYSDVIITSNIKEASLPRLNYHTYLNNTGLPDNALLMMLRILIRMGVKRAACAGMDGFGEHAGNYYRPDFGALPIISDEDHRNEEISAELQRLREHINIHFITTTRYRLS